MKKIKLLDAFENLSGRKVKTSRYVSGQLTITIEDKYLNICRNGKWVVSLPLDGWGSPMRQVTWQQGIEAWANSENVMVERDMPEVGLVQRDPGLFELRTNREDIREGIWYVEDLKDE